jgi:hypothetical protein
LVNYRLTRLQLGEEKTIYEDLIITSLDMKYYFDCLIGVSVMSEFEIAIDYKKIFFTYDLLQKFYINKIQHLGCMELCMFETKPQKGY